MAPPLSPPRRRGSKTHREFLDSCPRGNDNLGQHELQKDPSLAHTSVDGAGLPEDLATPYKGSDAVFFLHPALVGTKMQPIREDGGGEEQLATLRSGRWKLTEP